VKSAYGWRLPVGYERLSVHGCIGEAFLLRLTSTLWSWAMIAPLATRKTGLPKERLAPLRDGVVLSSSTTIDENDFVRLAVERQLRLSGYFPLLQVRCFVQEGVVVLYGTVPSYYMKQQAQTLVLNLEFIMRFENRCEVR
jgi:hypothetical protein